MVGSFLTPINFRDHPRQKACLISNPQQSGQKVIISPAEFYGYSSPQADLIQMILPSKVIIFHNCKVSAVQNQNASTLSPVELLIFPTESEDQINVYFLNRVVIISLSRRFSLHFACSSHYIASSKRVAFLLIWSITPWKNSNICTRSISQFWYLVRKTRIVFLRSD